MNYLVELVLTLIKSETTPMRRRIAELCAALKMPREEEDDDDEPYLPNPPPAQPPRPPHLIVHRPEPHSHKKLTIGPPNSRELMPLSHSISRDSRAVKPPPPPPRKSSRSEMPYSAEEERNKRRAEEDLLPEYQAEWEREYGKIRKLMEWKRNNGDKYWKDEERREIMRFINEGLRMGVQKRNLIALTTISNSSFKRWRQELKMAGSKHH